MQLSVFARGLMTAALVLTLPQRAMAQFTVYNTLSSFLAATTNAGTDTFNDLSVTFSTPAPLVRTAGTFGYTATVSTTSFIGAGATADRWLSANTANDIITFGGFGSGVRGVGGMFFATDAVGAVRAASSIVVTARTASGQSTQTLLNPAFGTFLGFVASADLLSLTVEALQPVGVSFAWPTVNDLVLANAPAQNVVPEPATWLLMASGFAGLVLIATHRRSRGR